MWTGPLLVALASLFAPAPEPPAAAPQAPAPPPGIAPDPGGLLAGPRVPRRDDPGGRRRPGAMDGRSREPMANPRQWLALLDKIELAPQQRDAVELVRGELRQAMSAFQETHGARYRELQAKASATRPPGEDLTEAERREIRELRDLRPRAEEYLMRIWRLLDENQQEQMRRLLAEAAKERRARGGRAPGPPGPDGPPPRGPGDEAGPMGPGDGPPPGGVPGLDPVARRRMEFLRRRQAPLPPPPDPEPIPAPQGSPPA